MANEVERIGYVGIVWASRYASGWTIYAKGHGELFSGLTTTEANRAIDHYIAENGLTLD